MQFKRSEHWEHFNEKKKGDQKLFPCRIERGGEEGV